METKLRKVLGFWPVFGACFGIAISGSTIMLLGNIFGMAGMPIIFSQLIALGVMILVVLAFAGAGQAQLDYAKLAELSGLKFGSLVSLSMVAIWFFVGIEMATPLAEEVKKPEKTLPRAMIAGLVVIFLIQLLLGPAMFGILGLDPDPAAGSGVGSI